MLAASPDHIHGGGVWWVGTGEEKRWAVEGMRPCSVVPDWSPGLIPSRITSLIYIDFDELKWILAHSGTTEQALKKKNTEQRAHMEDKEKQCALVTFIMMCALGC
jgi:hypothetical protein